jgi:uncharacterized protein
VKHYIRALSPRAEFAIVVGGAFGYFILGSVIAFLYPTPQIPISNATLQFLLVYESVVLLALLSLLRLRDWPLSHLGIRPTLLGTLVGAGLAAAAYLAYVAVFLVAAIISPYVQQIANEQMLVTAGLDLALIIAVSVVNPIFEEVFVCGYVISTLMGRRGLWTAVNVSIGLRLAYHLYQGPIGVISIIPLGFVFAYWYARTGRLWPVVVAHAIFDLVGLLELNSGE